MENQNSVLTIQSIVCRVYKHEIIQDDHVLYYFLISDQESKFNWSFSIRYRSLRELHEKIVHNNSVQKLDLPEFPKKQFGPKQKSISPIVIEQRKTQLENYLNQLFNNNKLKQLYIVQQFYQLTQPTDLSYFKNLNLAENSLNQNKNNENRGKHYQNNLQQKYGNQNGVSHKNLDSNQIKDISEGRQSTKNPFTNILKAFKCFHYPQDSASTPILIVNLNQQTTGEGQIQENRVQVNGKIEEKQQNSNTNQDFFQKNEIQQD